MRKNGALSGLRVVDYSQMVAGPYCAKVMGDLGADVVKVEPPGGDPSRQRGPFPGDRPNPEASGLFLYLNTNKRSVTLEPCKPNGREAFLKLVTWADVLVEDRPAEELRSLGLDYETLHAANPRLIVTSVTPFGRTGPYAGFKAYPVNCYHAGGDGYLLQSGPEFLSREPIKAGGYAGEYQAGVSAAAATLIAVYARELTGKGQHVDVSKQEALMSLNRGLFAQYPNENRVESRATRSYDYGGILPCKDGYIIIMAFTNDHFHALCRLIGNPEWVTDPRFKDRPGRGKHAQEINAGITAYSMQHTKVELYHSGQAAGFPIGMFCTPQDVMESPQMEARGFFAEVDHPHTGRIKYPTAPYRNSRTPVSLSRAPLLGEHNTEVYSMLGYNTGDLAAMRKAGAV